MCNEVVSQNNVTQRRAGADLRLAAWHLFRDCTGSLVADRSRLLLVPPMSGEAALPVQPRSISLRISLRIPPLCADSCESAGTAGYPDLIRPSGFCGAVSRQSRRGPFVGPRSSASRSSTRLHALSRACDPFEAFVFYRCLRGFPSLPVHPVVSPRVLAVLTSGFRWLLTFNCMSFLLRGAGCFVSQVVRALNQAGV